MEPYFAVGQYFGGRIANARHQFPTVIDLMVAHVDVPQFVHDADQVAFGDFTARIRRGEDVALLLVQKQCRFGGFPVFCVADGAELLVVVGKHDNFRFWSLQDDKILGLGCIGIGNGVF